MGSATDLRRQNRNNEIWRQKNRYPLLRVEQRLKI